MWRIAVSIALTWAIMVVSPPTIAIQADTELTVYASNYPLTYFAQRIGGDQMRVILPVPAEVDPAHWMPGEEQLLAMQRADLILLNGAGYEHWTSTISLPLNLVVDTSGALSDRYIYLDDIVTHTHGPSGEHSHENLASTTWLDLQIAAAQAQRIADALIASFPRSGDQFTTNLNILLREMETLDSELRSIGQRLEAVPLLASHPVYQYFARRYGLSLQSLHWEPEQVPSEQEWQNLEVLLGSHRAKWMIWQAPPRPETRQRLSRLGVQTLVIRPLANRPAEGDFLTVMQENLEALAEILPVGGDSPLN